MEEEEDSKFNIIIFYSIWAKLNSHTKFRYNISFISVNYYNFETAILATAVLAAVALAPPPVNLFPPQGAPQPGNIADGGGLTLVEALTVRVLKHR